MFSFLRIVNRLLRNSEPVVVYGGGSGKYDPLRSRLEALEMRTRMLLERAMKEGDGDPVPTLMAVLEGPDDPIQATAAQLLGEVAPAVTDETVRKDIVQALVNALGCPAIPRPAPSGFVTDLRAPLRVQAAEALGKYHDRGAVLELTEALRSDQPPVRRAAAWALGEIGAPEAVDVLSEVLPDPDSEVRAAVQMALRRIGTPDALAAIEQWKQSRSGGTSW